MLPHEDYERKEDNKKRRRRRSYEDGQNDVDSNDETSGYKTNYRRSISDLGRQSRFKPYPRAKKDYQINYHVREKQDQDIRPEDDDLATRTLYIGNLDVSITEEDIYETFRHFGRVMSVFIKRVPAHRSRTFAFVRFENMLYAYKAKSKLHLRILGSCPMVIGYGKLLPTSKIWIGHLDHTLDTLVLEREFDRFGAITKLIHYRQNGEAYVQYESVSAAEEARKQLTGTKVTWNEKKIVIDYDEPDTNKMADRCENYDDAVYNESVSHDMELEDVSDDDIDNHLGNSQLDVFGELGETDAPVHNLIPIDCMIDSLRSPTSQSNLKQDGDQFNLANIADPRIRKLLEAKMAKEKNHEQSRIQTSDAFYVSSSNTHISDP
ncbi:putative RNA-binding protein 15B [Halotydeus destructor]|nr:putative RNA-binding protein 15B [Halotydeus destructor]